MHCSFCNGILKSKYLVLTFSFSSEKAKKSQKKRYTIVVDRYLWNWKKNVRMSKISTVTVSIFGGFSPFHWVEFFPLFTGCSNTLLHDNKISCRTFEKMFQSTRIEWGPKIVLQWSFHDRSLCTASEKSSKSTRLSRHDSPHDTAKWENSTVKIRIRRDDSLFFHAIFLPKF